MAELGTTLQGLDVFLGVLRRHGVRSFSGKLDADLVEIEFHPASESVPDTRPDIPKPTARQLLQDDGSGLCECGHEMTSHNETGCLVGCDLLKCVPPDEAAP